MNKLTEQEKSEVMSRTLKTLDLVAEANDFEWKLLPKEVIMGMVGMYVEGVKYAKEIKENGKT